MVQSAPDRPRAGSRDLRPRLTALTRSLVVVSVSTGLLAGVTPALAQPVNPDDAAIAQAQATVEASNGEVARLAGTISATDSEINRVELEMGALREAVNKALVDLHDAQAEAERARQNAAAAKADLDATQAEIDAAQARLDEISRASYRQNGTSRGVSGVSGNGNTEDALDRQTYLRTTAEKERDAVAELDRLRTENANKESALRQARILAEDRERQAQEAERGTQADIEAKSGELSVLSANRMTLIAERQEAERNLDAARSQATGLQDQRVEYEEYQRAEEERARAQAEAAAAAEEKRKAEEAAATARREAEAAAAAGQAAREASEASAREAARIRAEEAKAAAERAQAEADARAADDLAAQQQRDAALTAASDAAAALVAASQPEHATTTNPYPSGEDAPATDIAAVQNPVADTGSYGPTDPGVTDLQQVTESATEVVTGDRAQQIETVIARGMAQIGTPYAWGGGNANGPTLGIRDGGVADSYGDYNKIGFDCSGLVLYAFAGVGIALPHYTGYQYQRGTQYPSSQMQRGDLIFYGPGASQHVAIYLGDGKMLEAPQSGSTVKVSEVRWSGMTPNVVRLI